MSLDESTGDRTNEPDSDKSDSDSEFLNESAILDYEMDIYKE